jgi:hypothetical protein
LVQWGVFAHPSVVSNGAELFVRDIPRERRKLAEDLERLSAEHRAMIRY